MKIKHILLTIPLLLLLSLMLCSCESSLETKTRNKITRTGTQWIKEKYKRDFTVDSSSYVESGYGLFGPSYSDDIIIHFTDGTDLVYLSATKTFADTYEAETINSDIESTLWPAVMEDMGDYYYYDYDYDTESYYMSPGFNYKCDDCEESFYTKRYSGDIFDYAQKEKMLADGSILLISSADEWKTRFDILKERMNTWFTGQETGELKITALNQACYEKVVDGTWKYPDIDLDGCWASMSISGESNTLVQNYIQPLPGVYVTSDEYDILLQEGDVTFEQVRDSSWIEEHTEDVYQQNILQAIRESEKTKNTITENNNDSKSAGTSNTDSSDEETAISKIDHFRAEAQSPVYRMVLSDRLLGLIDPDDFSMYIKFVPKEAGISEDSPYYEDCRFYYYPGNITGTSDASYPIYSEYASAGWYSYDSDDLFWWGTQKRLE